MDVTELLQNATKEHMGKHRTSNADIQGLQEYIKECAANGLKFVVLHNQEGNNAQGIRDIQEFGFNRDTKYFNSIAYRMKQMQEFTQYKISTFQRNVSGNTIKGIQMEL